MKKLIFSLLLLFGISAFGAKYYLSAPADTTGVRYSYFWNWYGQINYYQNHYEPVSQDSGGVYISYTGIEDNPYNYYYDFADFRYFGNDGNELFPPVTNAPLNPETANPQPDEANVGDPINFISGNNNFSRTEIGIAAPGIPLLFKRYYNSTETNSSVFGKGWRHSYDWSLAVESNTAAVTAGDARTYTFNRNSNGVYSASSDNNWQLSGPTNEKYMLLLPGSIAYRFDTNGVLQEISDGWSNTVWLVYSNSLLSSAEHSSGQSLEFAYSNELLSVVTATTNLSVAFTYSTNGMLTDAVRQTGSELFSESYGYDSSSLLTQRVDAAGSDYHYNYDPGTGKATGMYLTDDRWYEDAIEYSNALSRVIYFRDGEELLHDYDYNPATKRVLEERFANTRTTFDYTIGGDVTHQTVYDADTNRWTKIFRLYDVQHNITNEAFGLSATPTNITRYTWHPEWQVPTSMTDPEGFKAEYEYTNGAIAKERIWLSSNQTTETTYSYFTNGLLSAITNANGHSTAFTYDASGYPESVVPQTGPVMTFGYDSLGHLTNSALPGGRQTGYTVNPLGWVERIDYADTLYETFQYNGLGNVTNHVDRAERTTAYEYFPGGKLKAVSRQLGSTNVTVSYDFDQQFNTLSIKDELNRPVESYGLDPLDRPTTVTNLEGQTMSIRYLVGDFVDSITRFDNTVVSNKYNGDGRLEAVHYPDETNRYTYLRNGLFRTLENSGGMVSNGWNSASWLAQTVSSASSVTSVVNYSYDPVGNVTNTVVSIGSQQIGTSYAYDEAERLTNMVTGTQGFVYSYNTNNGLVASMLCTNTGVQAEYDYDLLDRIRYITWKDSWGATLLSFDYLYNAAGMITNVVKNGGSQVSYWYDDLDRLTGVTTDSGLVEYGYDFAGNRQTKTSADYTVGYALGYGNRLAAWNAVSTNDFLSKRTLRVQGYSSEAIGTDNRWGQLYVSNSVAVTPEVSGTNFWINSFVTGVGTQQIVAAIRDQAGNMGYATNEFCLTVITNGAYQYNAAGCVTNIAYSGADYAQNLSLDWNSQYQLTNATVLTASTTSTVSYTYDVLGRRTSRAEGTNVEHYVYDGNQVVADVDASGVVLRSYVWGPGIDNLLCFTDHTTSNTYYAIKDHLNSIYAFVDESGSVIESYEYDAWGRVLDIKDASGNSIANHQSEIGTRYMWQGREYDTEVGLYYFRARWYDPVAGRFISKDPIGVSGGLNQYVFCSNDPVNSIDPMGLTEDSYLMNVSQTMAGYLDGLLFGVLPNQNDPEYRAGQAVGDVVSLGTGLARLGYAGAAKGSSLILQKSPTMANAVKAVASRNTLKKVFRLNPWSEFRIYPYDAISAKYGGDLLEIIRAAGRTNPYLNLLGAGMAARAGNDLFGKDDDCK